MKLLFIAALIFLSHLLFSQSPLHEYHLIGIDDGVAYTIRIKEDFENEVISFKTGKDVFLIHDVRSVDTVITHLDRFLEIKLRVRGGSGVKVREKIVVGVNADKIFINLFVKSDVESRVTKVYDKVADSLKLFDEEEQYHVLISIAKKNNRYTATLTESNFVRSKFDPSQNGSFEKTYQLNFDKNGYYFFNSSKNLNDKFKLYSHKENKYSEKFLSTEAPAVELANGSYFFIDGIWYMEGRDNILLYR